ncbi:uncharacterized protein LOC135809996 isoform X2 [Sycon ciliatum]|uniref:uncharacterized protein LOC135809996 isoform X2 n=1 Tax=Sycon ciliatum TaxID=27933 RepID=UPI0031F60216
MPATGSGEGGDGDSKAKPTYSTRVFKKAAPNNKITAYLGRRDFFDTGEKVDVVDGVVLVDREYMNRETGWKVFVHLMAAFRYGREDLESSTGLIYKKDIYSKYFQVYPPLEENKKITRLQDRLIKKLGDSAYPFLFELPRHLAASVSILPAPNENGKPCGVDYQLTAFVGFGSDDKVDKKNSVRMAIKKLNLLSDNHRKQPSIDLKKDFVLSNYPVCIEARLDKELYIHGEEIKLFLNIDNRSSKTLKNLVVEIKQYAEITVGGISAVYKSLVAQIDSEVGFPVNPSSHMSQTYSLTPSMDCNTRQETKRGCALDGQYKVGESNLAASSVMSECPTPEMKEAQAIVVQYKLKAKLTVVRGTDIKFDLPFRLAHNRPTEPVFVRKSGEGATPQYVSVNQTEAANLMSTMSEYTSLKKPTAASSSSTNVASSDVYAQPKKLNAEKKGSAGGRISAPPSATSAVTVKRPTSQPSAVQPQQQQQQQQPAVANDLIDLMMFDPTKSAAAAPEATDYANVTLDPLFGRGAPAAQAAPAAQQMAQQAPVQNFMQQQPQQQAFGQPQQQFMAQQQQQPFGQPAAQAFMQPAVNPFGAQQQPQQQMFMPMQQQVAGMQQPVAGMQQPVAGMQQPAMFGAQQPLQQQMSSSNPFAMQQPQQQQQPFMGQQNFMGMAQPQQQQQPQQFGAGFGAFGAQPNMMQQQQKPKAAGNDDDFFEEFVNMRMDGSEA